MLELRKPPYSIEAEQFVLGGIMLRPDLIDELVCGPDDFYREDHQIIFAAIRDLHASRKPVDVLTVSDRLRNNGKLEDVGGLQYVGTIIGDTPSAANCVEYSKIVREAALKRQLLTLSLEIGDAVYAPKGQELGEIIELAEARLLSLRGTRDQSSEPQDMAEVMHRVQAYMETLQNGAGGLQTGFRELDELTTGLHPGDLVIVAGRPSMGKTTLALNIVDDAASRGKRAMMFSLEMSSEQLGMRQVAGEAGIDLMAMRSGKPLTTAQNDAMTRAMGMLTQRGILIDDTGGITPGQLRAKARRAARKGLDLIVVDYIQLMTCPGKDGNRTQEISEISRSLKALAKELKVPIIALSQLNRGVEQRDNKRPRMSDLRESGGIEQDADLIMFVYRDEVYNDKSPDKGTAEIIISKQRMGALGTVRLAFIGHETRFRPLAPGWRPEHREPEKPRRKGFEPPSSVPAPAYHEERWT
ncbi:MAG: replicative DNA helicase [Polycyclovorans sp.]|nr:replicative DNA helicase [Polycyclovorans sp.]